MDTEVNIIIAFVTPLEEIKKKLLGIRKCLIHSGCVTNFIKNYRIVCIINKIKFCEN